MDDRIEQLLEDSRQFRTSVVSEIHREIEEACGVRHPYTSLDPPEPHIINLKAPYNGKTPIRRNQYQYGEFITRDDTT